MATHPDWQEDLERPTPSQPPHRRPIDDADMQIVMSTQLMAARAVIAAQDVIISRLEAEIAEMKADARDRAIERDLADS